MATKKSAIDGLKTPLNPDDYASQAALEEKNAIRVDAFGGVLYKSHPSTATNTDAADDSVSEN